MALKRFYEKFNELLAANKGGGVRNLMITDANAAFLDSALCELRSWAEDKKIKDPFLTDGYNERIDASVEALQQARNAYAPGVDENGVAKSYILSEELKGSTGR